MSFELILVRHAEVAPEWKKICYGSLDVPLSEQGVIASQQFARRMDSIELPTLVFHSGLSRTETLASFIAERFCDGELTADSRIRERDYGNWQGLSWDDAYASDPLHFHDLVDKPNSYSPPGGETTTAMQRRIVNWFEDMKSQSIEGRVIAVSHSGPIAAMAGHLLGIPANQWQPWIIKYLESIWITVDLPGFVKVRRLDCQFSIMSPGELMAIRNPRVDDRVVGGS